MKEKIRIINEKKYVGEYSQNVSAQVGSKKMVVQAQDGSLRK